MRIEQLEYLIEISRHKSISKASENIHLTPQSLSRSVNSMEDELGFKLLERNFQGVHLTKAGELMLQTAQKIVASYHATLMEIKHNLSETQNTLKGNLTIYAHPVFTMSVFPSIISDFCTRYPEVNVCLIEGISQNISQQLKQLDEHDDVHRIGIITIPIDSQEMMTRYTKIEDYNFVPLMTGEYVVCVNKKSPLAKKKIISLDDLTDYSMIRFINSSGTLSEVLSYFLKQHGQENISFSTTSIGSWIYAIANDVGIGLIFDIVLAEQSIIREEFEKVAILHLQEKTALLSGALIPAKDSPVIQAFIAFAVEACRKI